MLYENRFLILILTKHSCLLIFFKISTVSKIPIVRDKCK